MVSSLEKERVFFLRHCSVLDLPRKYHRVHRICAHGEPVAQRYVVYLNLLCYSNEMSPISVPRKSTFLFTRSTGSHVPLYTYNTLPLARIPTLRSHAPPRRRLRASRSSDCLIVWQPMHYFHANRLRHCSRYIGVPCETERHSIFYLDKRTSIY